MTERVGNSEPKRHMISVGINYSGQYKLFGCHNDVESLKNIFYDTHPSKGEYQKLCDTAETKEKDTPTFENIKKAVVKVYSECKKGDSVIFSFSGHGGQTLDFEGDERDSLDECIYDVNLLPIKDDELYTLLVENLPLGVKLFVILDCCHSGSGLDLVWSYKPFSGAFLETKKSNSKTVYCISGCRDSETSADAWIDQKSQGALTANICSLVKENFRLRWKDFATLLHYNIKKSGYEQNVVLSYSYSGLEKKTFDL